MACRHRLVTVARPLNARAVRSRSIDGIMVRGCCLFADGETVSINQQLIDPSSRASPLRLPVNGELTICSRYRYLHVDHRHADYSASCGRCRASDGKRAPATPSSLRNPVLNPGSGEADPDVGFRIPLRLLAHFLETHIESWIPGWVAAGAVDCFYSSSFLYH